MWHVWVRRGGCIVSWWGNRKEGDHWGDVGVDGWIILGWISRRWNVVWTGYGIYGPGIEFWWGRDFRTHPERPWGPLSLLYNGYRVFPGVKAAGAWR